MKHQFIDVHRARYSVRRLCRVLHVSASGYYAACSRDVSARSQRQATLTAHIETIHRTSRATYGAPRVHAQLKSEGVELHPKLTHLAA